MVGINWSYCSAAIPVGTSLREAGGESFLEAVKELSNTQLTVGEGELRAVLVMLFTLYQSLSIASCLGSTLC